MPTISVCITHYNRPEKLAATLESLARQTRIPDEVLLWDDCSPRDPTSISSAYRHRFPRFIYNRNTINRGMPGNLNDVISQARGDLVANLHDADEFHPTLLEKWSAALEKYPDAGLVFCGVDAATKSEGAGKIWIHDVDTYTHGREFFRRNYLGTCSSKIWGTVMARAEVYKKHLPFDPQYRNWADVDMWMRICGTNGIAYVPEPLLVLDNTPTPHRMFSWAHYLIVNRMPFANIHRLAQSQVELLKWLQIQKKVAYKNYLRTLASRIAQGKWRDSIQGALLANSTFRHLHVRDATLETIIANRGITLRPNLSRSGC